MFFVSFRAPQWLVGRPATIGEGPKLACLAYLSETSQNLTLARFGVGRKP